MANAGTGSLCGLKPVLLAPSRVVHVEFSSSTPGETVDGVCSAAVATDGAGNTAVVTRETVHRNGEADVTYNAARAFDPAGALFARSTFGTITDTTIEGVFPLANGWVVGQASTASNGLASFLSFPMMDPNAPALFQVLPPFGMAPAMFGGAAIAGRRTFDDCGDAGVPLVSASFDADGGHEVFVHLGCHVDVPSELTVAENKVREVTVKGDSFVRLFAPGEGLFRFDFPHPGYLVPLADDHWALTEGTGTWTGTMEHNGMLSPPRCFLARTHDVRRFEVVFGGRGYLLYHDGQSCDRFLEFVLADGEPCGFVPIPDATECSRDTVTVGVDGTLALTDLDSCTIREWPGAFR